MNDLAKRHEIASRMRAHLKGDETFSFSYNDTRYEHDPAIAHILHVRWFHNTNWCTGEIDTLSDSTGWRIVHFLESDLPYEWPPPGMGWQATLKRTLRSLIAGRLHPTDFDPGVWPFARREDYERVQRLLEVSGVHEGAAAAPADTR